MQSISQILETLLKDKKFVILFKSNACFKSTTRSFKDLIFPYKPQSFQNASLTETGLYFLVIAMVLFYHRKNSNTILSLF